MNKKKEEDKYIVKVQVPLFTTGGATVLIYNEDRSIELELPMSPEFAKDLEKKMKGEPKAFFWAKTEDKMVRLLSIAPWQHW